MRYLMLDHRIQQKMENIAVNLKILDKNTLYWKWTTSKSFNKNVAECQIFVGKNLYQTNFWNKLLS